MDGNLTCDGRTGGTIALAAALADADTVVLAAVAHLWCDLFMRWSQHACHCHTVRLKIIGHEMIKHVGKSQSCMVSK